MPVHLPIADVIAEAAAAAVHDRGADAAVRAGAGAARGVAARRRRRGRRGARLRGREARLRVLPDAGADLRARLRRARRAAGVPDLDLPLLARSCWPARRSRRRWRSRSAGTPDRGPARCRDRGVQPGLAALRRPGIAAWLDRRRLPNRVRHATLRPVSSPPEHSHRVVHHSSGRLADLAADLCVDRRARAHLRTAVVAAADAPSRRRGWSIACWPNTGRAARRPSSSTKVDAAGAARPHPRRRPRQREEPAPGDEGSDRGGRPRRHARSRPLPHHARHDRRDGAAARPLRHGRRDDRDLRLADGGRHRIRSSSRTASRSRSTTPRSA